MNTPLHVELWASSPVACDINMTATAEVEAEAKAADGTVTPARFKVLAYTGKAMRPHTQPPLKHPVIVDLAGMEPVTKSIPALMDHDSKLRVGHTEAVAVENNALKATGIVSGTGPAAAEVKANAVNGYPWQISIGASLSNLQFVPEGQTASVNGRTAPGPVYVARASRLREVSFLTFGADDETAAEITAAAAAEGVHMDPKFKIWLTANGFDPESVENNDKQKATLEASWKAEVEAEATVTVLPAGTTVESKATDSADIAAALRDELKAIRSERRQNEVKAICGAHADIVAKATAGNWDDDAIKAAVEAAELKAQLKGGNSFGINTGAKNDKVSTSTAIEAAVCLSAGMVNIEKHFDEDTLAVAQETHRNGIGLQDLLLDAAASRGYRARRVTTGNLREVLTHAFAPVSMQAAGFTTLSLPGIFSTVANKFLLAGYTAVESSWKEIAAIRPVKDFKTVTSYRLNGDMQYDKIGPTGQIKHGTLSEASFTNKADTYAKMAALTRNDIINDDLGALTAVPQKLGRGGALKLNSVFWTEFLNNSSFFASGNSNYISGSTTNLSIDSLTTLSTTFLNQTDADGNPLGVEPSILLVPNSLFVLANTLMKATEIRDNTANSKTATANPFTGMYRVVRSSYLSNATITGYSTTAFYLLANPADVPVIEVALLNGRPEPVIETADADFNTLGIQMRGYHDFGVAKQDYRGGAKSKGAA